MTPSLEHHGIKGQKWGVRRYQNEDGSLTTAGKAHYGVSESQKGKNEIRSKAYKAERAKAASTKLSEAQSKLKKIENSDLMNNMDSETRNEFTNILKSISNAKSSDEINNASGALSFLSDMKLMNKNSTSNDLLTVDEIYTTIQLLDDAALAMEMSQDGMHDSNYMSHHGIKGQKWGRRRYQYEDGSLTAEGKIRYGVSDTGEKYLRARTGKSSADISTDELREIVNRTRLEKELDTLVSDVDKNTNTIKGKDIIDKTVYYTKSLSQVVGNINSIYKVTTDPKGAFKFGKENTKNKTETKKENTKNKTETKKENVK